jgi:hypothetical protein
LIDLGHENHVEGKNAKIFNPFPSIYCRFKVTPKKTLFFSSKNFKFLRENILQKNKIEEILTVLLSDVDAKTAHLLYLECPFLE